MSHGSLTDAVNASGSARWIASCSDSTPGVRCCIAHGHVACELVITCSPVARSNHALCRMPWWPGSRPVRIDVWLASVTVGSPAIAPHSYAVPISMRRATFGASPRGGHRRRARWGSRRRTGSRRRDAGRPASGSSTSVRTTPSWPARWWPCVVGARSRGARRWSARRRRAAPARGTRPSLRTPLPAITNGARACTTPSEPCSPRWPPWSSQLCAAECSTHRSGAAGWSKSCAIVVVRERVGVASPRSGAGRRARRSRPTSRSVRLVGERVGARAAGALVAVGRRDRRAGTRPRPSALAAS